MSSSQPITKPPVERTFHAAVAVLCLVALVQLVAAAFALLPRIDIDQLGRSFARPAVQPLPEPEAQQQAAPDVSAAAIAQANSLLDEGARFRDDGNLRGALEAVVEADRLVPNKPGILLQMASDQAMMGNKPAAIATLQRIVALPPGGDALDAGYVAQARSALSQLGVDPPASAQAGTAATAAPATQDAASMRDDVGIPVGSVMGIVEARLVDAEPGQKHLRVATKASSSKGIDSTKFQATVDIYEQDDGANIVQNTAPRGSEWLSGPDVDWTADPEIFQVKYRLPLEDRGDLAPLQYYGYVVAIYYDGELQDQRADPPSLLNQFAPPLHLNKDEPAGDLLTE